MEPLDKRDSPNRYPCPWLDCMQVFLIPIERDRHVKNDHMLPTREEGGTKVNVTHVTAEPTSVPVSNSTPETQAEVEAQMIVLNADLMVLSRRGEVGVKSLEYKRMHKRMNFLLYLWQELG